MYVPASFVGIAIVLLAPLITLALLAIIVLAFDNYKVKRHSNQPPAAGTPPANADLDYEDQQATI